MIMVVYFALLFVVFALRRSPSPALVLLAIYLASLGCGVLIGLDYESTTFFKAFNLLFVAMMLTLLIAPWNRIPFKAPLIRPNERRVRNLTRFLIALHSLGLVVFSIAFYYAITTVTDYSAFKSGGETVAFNKELPVNHTLHVLAIYVNWTAAFLVPLHFYHLLKRRYVLSIVCLIFSLNIVLEGISIFSRSSVVFYFMLYVLYLPFFYGKFDRRQRYLLHMAGVIVLVGAVAIFYRITANRFGGYFSSGDAAYARTSIQSAELYSVFDYASQWYRNGNVVMAEYSFTTLHGQLSFPIVPTVANKLGLIDYPPETVDQKLKTLWGDRYDKFVGLVPNLVFDFGYAITTLFVLLYGWILRRLRPVRGAMPLASLVVLGPLFVLPAMGIQGSLMKATNYNLLILYSLGVYAYLFQRRRRRQPTIPAVRSSELAWRATT